MSKNLKLTPTAIKEIQKIANANKGSISAAQYRSIVSKGARKTSRVSIDEFGFTLDVKKLQKNKGYIFTLHGRHLSTNAFNSLGMKAKMRYKSAIKKAFNEWYAINRKLRPTTTYENAVLQPIHYNPKSRDDDSGAQTNKTMRDYIIRCGFVKDDDREHLEQEKTVEVIQKEYKVEMVLLQK